MNENDERNKIVITSVCNLFFPLIAPLIMYVINEGKVKEHAKEVLNFSISYSLYSIIASISMFILIGFILLPLVALLFVIFAIIGIFKTLNNDFSYRYPLTIRLLK